MMKNSEKTALVVGRFEEWADVLTEYAGEAHCREGFEHEPDEIGLRSTGVWYEPASDCDLREIAREGLEAYARGEAKSIREAIESAAYVYHRDGYFRELEQIREKKYDHRIGVCQRQSELVSLIQSVVPGLLFYQSASGSWYAHKRSRGDAPELKLRVSDHPQVRGGGFNEGTGLRMGEADISWIVDSPIADLPTQDEIYETILGRMHWLDEHPDASPREIFVPELELYELEVPLHLDKEEQERLARVAEYEAQRLARAAEWAAKYAAERELEEQRARFRERFADILKVQGGKQRQTPEWKAFFKARATADQATDFAAMEQVERLLEAAMNSTP